MGRRQYNRTVLRITGDGGASGGCAWLYLLPLVDGPSRTSPSWNTLSRLEVRHWEFVGVLHDARAHGPIRHLVGLPGVSSVGPDVVAEKVLRRGDAGIRWGRGNRSADRNQRARRPTSGQSAPAHSRDLALRVHQYPSVPLLPADWRRLACAQPRPLARLAELWRKRVNQSARRLLWDRPRLCRWATETNRPYCLLGRLVGCPAAGYERLMPLPTRAGDLQYIDGLWYSSSISTSPQKVAPIRTHTCSPTNPGKRFAHHKRFCFLFCPLPCHLDSDKRASAAFLGPAHSVIVSWFPDGRGGCCESQAQRRPLWN